MARYIGPKTRISRKFGEPIFGEDKYYERRKYPPGQHGFFKKRIKRSNFSIQLFEKQKLKYIYGILEKQCRKIFKKSVKIKGNTGKIFIQLLEMRLDNILYRLNFSSSRNESRQLINHGHIKVNNNKVNIPSFILKVNDKISVKEKIKNNIKYHTENKKKTIPEWLYVNYDYMEGKIISIPNRKSIPENINENLIVEWYSK